MKKYGVFDIIGPIMIGPSSSHTAGAARLGKVAGAIAGEKIKSVKFLLHGSFAKTYKGHGTDRALVAGIMGFEPWDDRIRNSLEIAKQRNISIEFIETDLGSVHPNTVKFLITNDRDEEVEVMGSSIGGGSIVINEVNYETVEFNGEYPTLLIKHVDLPGMITKVSELISQANVNIAFLKVYRVSRGKSAAMVFETDSVVSCNIIEKIRALKNIEKVVSINVMEKGE
ncbi:MAG: L-serine ammonia-lyase, iron-sulfur-dependent subunit beta [Clostridium sp.]|nr:L-serine ammonia-lyase, iron-sulfur-dependent subunit beta [Clostridium sp.]